MSVLFLPNLKRLSGICCYGYINCVPVIVTILPCIFQEKIDMRSSYDKALNCSLISYLIFRALMKPINIG